MSNKKTQLCENEGNEWNKQGLMKKTADVPGGFRSIHGFFMPAPFPSEPLTAAELTPVNSSCHY